MSILSRHHYTHHIITISTSRDSYKGLTDESYISVQLQANKKLASALSCLRNENFFIKTFNYILAMLIKICCSIEAKYEKSLCLIDDPRAIHAIFQFQSAKLVPWTNKQTHFFSRASREQVFHSMCLVIAKKLAQCNQFTELAVSVVFTIIVLKVMQTTIGFGFVKDALTFA